MATPTNLDQFLEHVMDINAIRMGGASAGIMGNAGTDSIILNDLKRAAINFAQAYKNHADLQKISDEIYGYLQTLQATCTLSDRTADELVQELTNLTDPAGA